MKIKTLTLTNLRAYEYAEFNFNEGVNLLVGINGSGKSTVLDALNVCLSVIFSNIPEAKVRKQSFSDDDIRVGTKSLQVSCDFTYLGVSYNLLIEKNRERRIITNKTKNDKEKIKFLDDKEIFIPSFNLRTKKLSELGRESIGVIFSTKRSLVTREEPSKTASVGGKAAAFVDAFSSERYFNLKIFADWYKVQEALSKEKAKTKKHAATLKKAIELFLPGFNNLKVLSDRRGTEFYIDKDKKPFKLSQLSDGERGVIALVFDIARRLSQANPLSSDALAEGNGVVLIDELDLHLHPRWQRNIIENLSNTFPNLQFIATTHSPQIIPAIEPERIQLIYNKEVLHPDRSLGLDSNWILKNLMDSEDRPTISSKAIAEVEAQINKGNLTKALSLINKYKNEQLELAEWSTLEARISKLKILSGAK